MKLLSFGIRGEGKNPQPSILWIGRNKESTGKFNGLWFRFINPFSKETSYVDPITFNKVIGDCHWHFAFWIRKIGGQKWGTISSKGYFPLDL
jgi:hypothetical protein